jgi:hypothetical protein
MNIYLKQFPNIYNLADLYPIVILLLAEMVATLEMVATVQILRR